MEKRLEMGEAMEVEVSKGMKTNNKMVANTGGKTNLRGR